MIFSYLLQPSSSHSSLCQKFCIFEWLCPLIKMFSTSNLSSSSILSFSSSIDVLAYLIFGFCCLLDFLFVVVDIYVPQHLVGSLLHCLNLADFFVGSWLNCCFVNFSFVFCCSLSFISFESSSFTLFGIHWEDF